MNPHDLKAALPRTWGPFFLRHGNFTAAQLAAIPPLLQGDNLLLCAPTAGGKTEAALAPLIERHLPADRDERRLTILYLLPTRALISNLWARLQAPLEALRITAAVKTHDLNTFNPRRPAEVLFTTPESLDAMLAGQAKLLNGLRAVVLDELHIFDGTVRGDQLRVLLSRLRAIRAHAADAGDDMHGAIQFAALSATLSQPETVAARYFAPATVAQVGGGRTISAETLPAAEDSPDALREYLGTFRQRGWRKALVFCNTRAEVESYATALRTLGSPFGDAVFVHYSNLEPERRAEIERQFSQAQAAICFASSTLELGIDIGDIDVAILIGAPGSSAAFMQRLGRAGRRQRVARVACFYRTPLERIIFAALLDAPEYAAPTGAFRPSVAIQQIFSLLKQSPSGALRLNPLAELFAGMLAPDDLRAILGNLQMLGYLRSGRPGEWRAGEKLNQLVDLQSAETTTLSLYSNIDSGGAPIKIRDQMTQRVVASVDRQWFDRDLLTLEGRPLNVHWYDGDALWVSPYRGPDAADQLRYVSTRQLLSYELAQELPAQFGLPNLVAPLLPSEEGQLLFHWLGDIYGRAFGDLVGYTLFVKETAQQGLCLQLNEEPDDIPVFSPAQVRQYLQDNYRRYEPLLALGAYHHLLPVELRRRAVVEQFDIERFVAAVAGMHIDRVPEALAQDLLDLLTK